MTKNGSFLALGRLLPALALTLILAARAQAGNTYTVLHAFAGTDGGTPGSLIFDAAGNLYGTTSGGGRYGNGTVFKLTPASGGGWKESVLYSFKGGADGSFPVHVIFDAGDHLVGGTWQGGAHNVGTIFKLTQSSGGSWKKTELFSFNPGASPWGPLDLIFDPAGNLYGSAAGGGADGGGSIFKLTPVSGGRWKETVVHIFPTTGQAGFSPSELILDGQGSLYGTTISGGPFGFGSVYKLTRTGRAWKLEVLHPFGNFNDGASPVGLIFDKRGNLFGTTAYGGTQGFGTAFKLTPSSGGAWTENVLYSFRDRQDGAYPLSGLVSDEAGNLFGSASSGGGGTCFALCGVVYKLTPIAGGNWKESVLHEFIKPEAGLRPISAPVLDSMGNLYGTTEEGGNAGCLGAGCGLVYKLTAPHD
jgi:uncharacterized repeat protein (TIGR03803 family)